MTQEIFHLFWNSASKSRGEGKPIYNKEEKNWIFSEVTKIWGKKRKKTQHDSDEEKEKTQKKTTYENDSDDTIPESVSKLNKIVFYDDTYSGSWKSVV